MFCPFCRAIVEDDSVFCISCGKRIKAEDDTPAVESVVPQVQSESQNTGYSGVPGGNVGDDKLICAFDIPENVRKQYAKYLRLEIYADKVVGKGNQLGDITYFFKNYMDVRWTPACVATQYAQVVFITPQNASNYITANNLDALSDVNKIPFCSGMFSYNEANDYSKNVCMVIKDALTKFQQNYSENNTQQVIVQNNISSAEEIMKLKELLDMGILTEEEFAAKKKQILGI